MPFCGENAGLGLQMDSHAPGLSGNEAGYTPASIATCTRHTAIGIEEADGDIRNITRADEHELIESHTPVAITDSAHEIARKVQWLLPSIQNNEVIAKPVHLEKGYHALRDRADGL